MRRLVQYFAVVILALGTVGCDGGEGDTSAPAASSSSDCNLYAGAWYGSMALSLASQPACTASIVDARFTMTVRNDCTFTVNWEVGSMDGTVTGETFTLGIDNGCEAYACNAACTSPTAFSGTTNYRGGPGVWWGRKRWRDGMRLRESAPRETLVARPRHRDDIPRRAPVAPHPRTGLGGAGPAS